LLRRLPFSTDAYAIGLITYKVRSENGYGFLRPGLKTGGGNGIFWSEIGSGFGDAGGTAPPKIPRGTPRAHQAGAYPGFCSMKQIGIFLLPPGWDASPSQSYPHTARQKQS